MTGESVMRGVSRVFLDTAPVVYYIEEHPLYLKHVQPIFAAIDAGHFTAVTSPITLAECLVLPYRMHQLDLLQSYRNTIVHGLFTDFHVIDETDGLLASQIRARYNLSLPDSLQFAAAISAQCDAFLTNDLDLRRVTELRVITIDELPA